MFRLTIETDNAAFEGDGSVEVARILREVAKRVMGEDEGSVRDINGNKVGTFALTGRK